MSRLGCPSSAATPETVRQSALPLELRALDISPKIRADPDTLESVSSDFGGVISGRPYAIFYPSNETDIARLIRTAFESAQPFTITARCDTHCFCHELLSAWHGSYNDSTKLSRNDPRTVKGQAETAHLTHACWSNTTHITPLCADNI